MVKVRNIFGDIYSGKVNKAGVFATWKGIQYRRMYVVPSNPKTPAQTTIRGYFKNAVDAFHDWNSYMKLCYDYLAAGQAMSGYNLWISRYQKATAAGEAAPGDPIFGVMMVGSAFTLIETEEVTAGTSPLSLAHAKVGFWLAEEAATGETRDGLTVTNLGADPAIEAYIDLKLGQVYFAENMTGAVTISYEAGGRVVTDEAIGTDPTAGTQYLCLHSPVDIGTVVIKEAAVQIESVEIDNVAGKIYYDKTEALTNPTVDYYYLTPLSNARIQIEKTNTSFVCWRDYADTNGIIELALTSEDQPYDLVVDLANYVSQSYTERSATFLTDNVVIVLAAA